MSAHFRVYKGGLSGRYFASLMTEDGNGLLTASGKKYDVTDDIEFILSGRVDASSMRFPSAEPAPTSLAPGSVFTAVEPQEGER